MQKWCVHHNKRDQEGRRIEKHHIAHLTGTASWTRRDSCIPWERAHGLEATPLGGWAPPRVPSRGLQAGPAPVRRVFHLMRQGSDEGSMSEETSYIVSRVSCPFTLSSCVACISSHPRAKLSTVLSSKKLWVSVHFTVPSSEACAHRSGEVRGANDAMPHWACGRNEGDGGWELVPIERQASSTFSRITVY